MSLKDEIYQLYSQRNDNKILISQVQQYLIADDKTEKSLRNAFVNCAAAFMSDSELKLNNQPIVLQLIELVAKLCQIKPSDHEYLHQLNAYLMLSLTEYSAQLAPQLISQALFGNTPVNIAAVNSSKQLSHAITPVKKPTSASDTNISVVTSNTMPSVEGNISMVTKNMTPSADDNINVVTKNTAQLTVQQSNLTVSFQKSSGQQSAQLATATSATPQISPTSSAQQTTPKKSSPQLAVKIIPTKKTLETWTVSDRISSSKHTLH